MTAALLLLASFASTAQAEPGQVGVTRQPTGIEGEPEGLGLGIVVGEPSGLAFAYREGEETNIQGGIGWSFGYGRINVAADYTRNLLILRPDDTPEVRFPVYAGVGGRIWLGFDDDFGRRRTHPATRSGSGSRSGWPCCPPPSGWMSSSKWLRSSSSCRRPTPPSMERWAPESICRTEFLTAGPAATGARTNTPPLAVANGGVVHCQTQ